MGDNSLHSELIAASNRRSFVRKLGIASAVLGASGTVGKAQTPAPQPTDADILNFALNLEYLEAEFYTIATTDQTLDRDGIGITGTGVPGATTGGG